MTTEHSKKYDRVKKYYDAGLWHEEQVRAAVEKKWVTKAEYKTITGESYA